MKIFWKILLAALITVSFRGNARASISATNTLAPATTQPKGEDPNSDSDGDGQSNLEELIANTNASNPKDRFDIAGITAGLGVHINGRAGRQYILERALDLSAAWSGILTNNVLNADTTLLLSDPNPPVAGKLFYRVRVVMP